MTEKEAEVTRVRAALDQLTVALRDRNVRAVREIMGRLVLTDPAAVEVLRRKLMADRDDRRAAD